jgi:hypothetical protein
MNDKDFDRLLEEALRIPIPEGLAERLEQELDRCAAAAGKQSKARRLHRLISAAAAVVLAAAVLLPAGNPPRTPDDTFADPAEAAAAAEDILVFMSAQLNEGLRQVTDAGREFEKANKTLKKYFNK